MENSQHQIDSNRLENLRCAYSNAVSIWTSEGNSIWNKITAMITANTIMFTTIGIIITASKWNELWMFIPVFCTIGILLCICWLMIIRRSFIYFNYWIISARNLEKELVGVDTVNKGKQYSEIINTIYSEKYPSEKKVKLKFYDRIKIEHIINSILSIFIFTYIIILFFIQFIK